VWEGDRDRLNQVSLLTLLQDLRATAPTAEQLQSRLDIAVHSLSKAAEYTLVSSVIMRRVGRLYPDMGMRRGLAGEEVYGTIAESLAQNASGDRIKKLLLLACKNTWITDGVQLAEFNLVDLVQELHGLTPSLMTLQAVLESLVNTLSKRAEYTLAAHEICSAFQPLYTEAVTEIRTEVMTEIVAAAAPVAVAVPQQASHTVSDLADLFNLRLEIMRYSNPYRVKIVLFSLLCQPFESQAEQEYQLKSYTLDDLLRSMIQAYKLPELEIRLLNTARELEDSEESLQAARAVLGAVKPFYAHLPSSFGAAEEDATAFMGSEILLKKKSRAELRKFGDESGELTIVQSNTMPGSSFRPSQILAH
jgi:hypothetical protein